MAHSNTILAQILKFVPRHKFETLAKQHHSGRSFRSASRWSQFVTMTMAQLSGRSSLRDIVENLSAQQPHLYHLGCTILPRSTLSRINEEKSYTLYQALFAELSKCCQACAPRHGFRFKNLLYSLDASIIDLSMEVFPWADFRATKGAIKLHVGLNHDGYLPEFVTITQGKTHDVTVGRSMAFPKGSLVVMDRGYTDYQWYNQLTNKGIFFVTRLKSNAKVRVLQRQSVPAKTGVGSDHTIEFTGTQTAKRCPIPLRRIGYRDPQTGKRYVFLTNHFRLSAKTIAEIYKARWQVELFFKWIKQNLKIKSFVGTSKNAVMTQIWIALCTYFVLAFLKFQSRANRSMQQILRVFQLNLFARRDLWALLRGNPSEPERLTDHQLTLL